MSAIGLVLSAVGSFGVLWTLVIASRYGAGNVVFSQSLGKSLGKNRALLAFFELITKSVPFERARERARALRVAAACKEGVPEMLDILTLGLSAGLSFDASLDLYCTRFSSELSELLGKTRLVWGLGLASRAQALQSMAESVNVPALSRFASAVEESLMFGTPLADTLVRQGTAIRSEHRREVEEAIEKVPVKMLIPLATLVLPAMFVAVLGPVLAPAVVELVP